MFSAGETVTVLRPATRDRTGDRTGDPIPHVINGCAINIAGRSGGGQNSTDNDRRETLTTTIELMCPPGADILPGDRVRLPSGLECFVEGLPWQPHNPFTGWEVGVAVRLKAVTDAK